MIYISPFSPLYYNSILNKYTPNKVKKKESSKKIQEEDTIEISEEARQFNEAVHRISQEDLEKLL